MRFGGSVEDGLPSGLSFGTAGIPGDEAFAPFKRVPELDANTADMFADECPPLNACISAEDMPRTAGRPDDELLGGGTFKNAVKRGDGGVDAEICDAPLFFDDIARGDSNADRLAAATVFVAGELPTFPGMTRDMFESDWLFEFSSFLSF